MKYVMRTLLSLVEDQETKEEILKGGFIETYDRKRVESAVEREVCELYSATEDKKVTGGRVFFYVSYLAPFGGIETATMELARRFGREKNLEFIVNVADKNQMLELSKHANVRLDDGKDFEFEKDDILILVNYDTARIVDRIKKFPKKIFQQNHCVWDKLPNLHFKDYLDHKDKINAVLSVSEEARRGLKARYGVDSIVVPNVVYRPRETVVFGFFSRSSAEKGFDTILPAIRKFKASGKKFLFVVSTASTDNSQRQLADLKNNQNVVVMKGGANNRGLIHMVDYLWQLSETESQGLSVYEALLSGVPVVASKIPVFEEIIKNGENGFLVSRDLSDLPIEEIFDRKMLVRKSQLIKDSETIKAEKKWEEVFKGKI